VNHPNRLRRPDLERSERVRSFSTLFGAPSATAAWAATPPDGNGGPSLSYVVTHSVDLGYRIVDDYIRQGEKAARRLSERPATPQSMIGDAQDMATRFAEHASGLAAVWLELLQVTTASSGLPLAGAFRDAATTATGVRPAAPTQPAPAQPRNGAEAATVAADHARVRIEVASTQPTEVAIDLQPSTTRSVLIVHDLRAADPETPRIADVAFEPGTDDRPARLRLRVPAGHPPGVYNGLIVDAASSRPVGSVSVSVGRSSL
jgi:hypothetical protein